MTKIRCPKSSGSPSDEVAFLLDSCGQSMNLEYSNVKFVLLLNVWSFSMYLDILMPRCPSAVIVFTSDEYWSDVTFVPWLECKDSLDMSHSAHKTRYDIVRLVYEASLWPRLYR